MASTLSIDQQHSAVLSCCESLLMALNGDRVSDIGALRMELAGLLHANLSREETEINGPIRRAAAEKRPYLFNELAAEASTLRERYTHHVGHWSLAKLRADREHYAEDARGLVQDVRSHLKKKRAVMPQWLAFIRAERTSRPSNS